MLEPRAVHYVVVESNMTEQGTGDDTFEQRLRLGGPLLKENIATMARSLLYWLGNEAGYRKMGVCGLSMGKTSTLSPSPVVHSSRAGYAVDEAAKGNVGFPQMKFQMKFSVIL
ncbi:hypothetical protein POM88_053610 [Heracleum sosnowskyi]|uniref:Uncharacterized protein n=1 Tax=Heracleum sosnowskyi TaxID=360622 RepID=A0AAD8GQ74_9APIA|nr:hypothetical protein POM88_053610 [Heracleum sosnowskyi]